MEEFIATHIQGFTHWPFVAFAVVAMLINQVVKGAIFTKTRAHIVGKYQWVWWWGWKTLPLHPVSIGAIVGLIWRNPECSSHCWPVIASVFYFALSGALSVWLYQIIKGLAKRRLNIDLELPGNGQ